MVVHPRASPRPSRKPGTCVFAQVRRLGLVEPRPAAQRALETMSWTTPTGGSQAARATGLEPATTGSTVRYSNQLSYAPGIRARAGDADQWPALLTPRHVANQAERVA